MVSKASEDFPDPLTPVKAISLPLGRSRSRSRRLCWRAPRMRMESDTRYYPPKRASNAWQTVRAAEATTLELYQTSVRRSTTGGGALRSTEAATAASVPRPPPCLLTRRGARMFSGHRPARGGAELPAARPCAGFAAPPCARGGGRSAAPRWAGPRRHRHLRRVEAYASQTQCRNSS